MPRPTALPPFLTASPVLSATCSAVSLVYRSTRSAVSLVLSQLRLVSFFAPDQVLEQADRMRAAAANANSFFILDSFQVIND